jgi:hypothetical protein
MPCASVVNEPFALEDIYVVVGACRASESARGDDIRAAGPSTASSILIIAALAGP